MGCYLDGAGVCGLCGFLGFRCIVGEVCWLLFGLVRVCVVVFVDVAVRLSLADCVGFGCWVFVGVLSGLGGCVCICWVLNLN